MGKRIFLVLLIISFGFTLLAGDGGFRIELRIKNLPDTSLFLAHYYGDKTYLDDTAYLEKNGRFIFSADTLLPGGVYIVAGQNHTKYFELLIDREQNFRIETEFPDFIQHAKIKGSTDNMLFFKFLRENGLIRKGIWELQDSLKKVTGEEARETILKRIDELNQRSDSIQRAILQEAGPESFTSVLLNAMTDPAAGDTLKKLASADSLKAYRYFKDHYWDNLNPSDERLLRTPLYHNRLSRYFSEVILQDPDTLITEIDHFVSRLNDTSECFKYVVWYLTYRFETSKIMGFDEIFVHMVDTYYSSGRAYWASASTVKTLRERAEQLRRLLIGAPAPDLILMDTLGGFKSLYAVKSPLTLVLFYEYGCSHCRKEIKELKQWDEKNSFGIRVFAVCTDTSLTGWKNFIHKENLPWVHVNATRSVTPDYHQLYDIRTTPTIYLLDEQKRIVAKRISVAQIREYLPAWMAEYRRKRKSRE
ncbi:MAG: hypothetical protein Kow00127_19640 [Bacteroidales bacterium]